MNKNYSKLNMIKEKSTFIFAIFSISFYVIFYVISQIYGGILTHITIEFDVLNIILYALIILQSIAVLISENKITVRLYMVSFVGAMVICKHYHLVIILMPILFFLKRKSDNKKSIRKAVIICMAIWMLNVITNFALTGYFITKTELHLYESPYDNGYLEVMEDYQFGEKVLTYVHYGNAPKRQFWIYTYVSATERIDKIYNKIDDVDNLEIEWIDKNTVLINGKARHILSK